MYIVFVSVVRVFVLLHMPRYVARFTILSRPVRWVRMRFRWAWNEQKSSWPRIVEKKAR